jgi:hypothetical protein
VPVQADRSVEKVRAMRSNCAVLHWVACAHSRSRRRVGGISSKASVPQSRVGTQMRSVVREGGWSWNSKVVKHLRTA